MKITEDMVVNSEWVDLDTELDLSDLQNGECEHSMDEREEILDRFTFHPPKEGQEELYEAIRHISRDMAMCIRDLCPEGREKALALTKLEEASFWANAAIARS